MPAESRERLELLKEIGDIVKQHGGLESNIPLGHKYWDLLNRYRLIENTRPKPTQLPA